MTSRKEKGLRPLLKKLFELDVSAYRNKEMTPRMIADMTDSNVRYVQLVIAVFTICKYMVIDEENPKLIRWHPTNAAHRMPARTDWYTIGIRKHRNEINSMHGIGHATMSLVQLCRWITPAYRSTKEYVALLPDADSRLVYSAFIVLTYMKAFRTDIPADRFGRAFRYKYREKYFPELVELPTRPKRITLPPRETRAAKRAKYVWEPLQALQLEFIE